MNNTIDAYPLTWPAGYTRTPADQRTWSKFKQTYGKAQAFLHKEVQRVKGKDLIVSTNLRVRKDGLLYADELNRRIDDPGVAIYFKYKGKDVSMCCDQFTRIWENMYALGKGIEALRGMERWGVSDFLERAFTGFTALPPAFNMPYERSCWEVLDFAGKPSSVEEVQSRYRALAKERHPDVGGTDQAFAELVRAYEIALSHFL